MKQNRKTAGRRLVSLLLALVLLIGALPMPAFAQGGTEEVKQALEALNETLSGEKFQIDVQESTVTVSSAGEVDLGDKKVQLKIPGDVTVKWNAKITGTGDGALIELIEGSEGIFEWLSDASMSNPLGEGIVVKGGIVEIHAGANLTLVSSKRNGAVLQIEGDGALRMTGGTIVSNILLGYAVLLKDGVQFQMSGGTIEVLGTGGTGITVQGQGSLATISEGNVIVKESAGNGCGVDISGGTVKVGKQDTTGPSFSSFASGTVYKVTGDGTLLNVLGGNVSSEKEADLFKITSKGMVNVVGGLLVSKDSGKIATLNGATLDIAGGTVTAENRMPLNCPQEVL